MFFWGESGGVVFGEVWAGEFVVVFVGGGVVGFCGFEFGFEAAQFDEAMIGSYGCLPKAKTWVEVDAFVF